MTKVIVFDLLTLTCCRHPEREKIEQIKNPFDLLSKICPNSDCCQSLRDLHEYKIKISQTSFQRFRKVSDDEVGRLFGRLIRNGIVVSIRCNDDCKKGLQNDVGISISGNHEDEYYDIALALSESFKKNNFRCAVLCLDGTFSYNHVRKLSGHYGVAVNLRDVSKKEYASIVEVFT